MRDRTTDRGTRLGSFRRYTWWAVPGTTAIVLLWFVGDWILDPDVPAWARGSSAAALAVTVAASVVLLSRRLALVPTEAADPQSLRLPAAWLVAGSAGAAVLGVIPLALRNYGLWAIAPAIMASITATFLPPRRRRVLLAGAAAAAPVPGGTVSLLSGDGELLYAALFPLGLVAFTAWVTLGPVWAWDIAARLSHARTLAAELAVKDERLRFAADLHDIQGHHLQVIALKSELAARLIEADQARAAAEMKDVHRLATDALNDTRALVQGYRRTTLDNEIANATGVLAAADVDVRMNLEPAAVAVADRLSPSSRHLLGLVMREATTNVLRHSRARQAEVDYRVAGGRASLRVRNDGAVGRPDGVMGSGLRTLAERLEAAGGELTWTHDGDHFEVTASLPVDAGPERAGVRRGEVAG
jgi:two-component system, NarL family, sensor histidine kinase DesK